MHSYWGPKENIKIHYPARYATWLTKIQHGSCSPMHCITRTGPITNGETLDGGVVPLIISIRTRHCQPNSIARTHRLFDPHLSQCRYGCVSVPPVDFSPIVTDIDRRCAMFCRLCLANRHLTTKYMGILPALLATLINTCEASLASSARRLRWYLSTSHSIKSPTKYESAPVTQQSVNASNRPPTQPPKAPANRYIAKASTIQLSTKNYKGRTKRQ